MDNLVLSLFACYFCIGHEQGKEGIVSVIMVTKSTLCAAFLIVCGRAWYRRSFPVLRRVWFGP